MDKKEALKIVKNRGTDIITLPEKFIKDREVVLEAVKNNGISLFDATVDDKTFLPKDLWYTSNYDNKNSKSNLKIYDFKVKNVPILAKILTLASLQGIADLLTGEGIRFNEFDMNFNTVGPKIEINNNHIVDMW